MKKIILSLLLLIGLNYATAQDFSYGVITGVNVYDIEIDGPLIASDGRSGLNIGGFAEYQLNSSFGVRGNLLYSNVKENDFGIIEGSTLTPTYSEVNLKIIQLHALVRYDLNKQYNKGFYLTGGLRINYNLSAKTGDKNLEEFYNKANLGAMLGFGVNFAKHFGLELIPEVNLTNTINSNENKSRNFGFYTNLTVNLESLFRK